MESGSDKIYHYKVNESLENNKVKYSLKKHKNKNLNDKEFIKAISNHLNEQDGAGRHRKHHKHHLSRAYDDSSSSSSEDDDYYYTSKKRVPRCGDPMVMTYYPTIYGVQNIVMPTTISSLVSVAGIGPAPLIITSGRP